MPIDYKDVAILSSPDEFKFQPLMQFNFNQIWPCGANV